MLIDWNFIFFFNFLSFLFFSDHKKQCSTAVTVLKGSHFQISFSSPFFMLTEIATRSFIKKISWTNECIYESSFFPLLLRNISFWILLKNLWFPWYGFKIPSEPLVLLSPCCYLSKYHWQCCIYIYYQPGVKAICITKNHLLPLYFGNDVN